MAGSIGHNVDWSDRPEDFESFCDNFILLPTIVGILLCLARFVDQSLQADAHLVQGMIQMRLFKYSMYKVFVLFSILISTFVATLWISSSKLVSSSSSAVNVSSIDPSVDLAVGPFFVRSPTVTSFNQQLWVEGAVKLRIPENITETIEDVLPISLKYITRSQDAAVNPVENVMSEADSSRTLKCFPSASSRRMFPGQLVEHNSDPVPSLIHALWTKFSVDQNHKMRFRRTLETYRTAPESLADSSDSRDVWCETMPIMHFTKIDFHQLILVVKTDMSHFRFKVAEFQFQFSTFNPDFVKLMVWVRFFLLVMSFLASCFFANSLRRFHVNDWLVEQKWVAFTLPILLLFNDPLFPLIFLLENWTLALVDQLLMEL